MFRRRFLQLVTMASVGGSGSARRHGCGSEQDRDLFRQGIQLHHLRHRPRYHARAAKGHHLQQINLSRKARSRSASIPTRQPSRPSSPSSPSWALPCKVNERLRDDSARNLAADPCRIPGSSAAARSDFLHRYRSCRREKPRRPCSCGLQILARRRDRRICHHRLRPQPLCHRRLYPQSSVLSGAADRPDGCSQGVR